MVLTVSFVVSPETGLYCLRPRCDAKHRHQVDTSVGVSGRYDFAVRLGALRRKHLRRPSHPAPTFVTIAKRPSCGPGRREQRADLRRKEMKIFLRTALDSFCRFARRAVYARRAETKPHAAITAINSEISTL